MPTYEYQCGDCGHTFEAFQSMKDDPLSDCPKCGGTVRRVLSGGAGIIFKGEGFYITDKAKGGGKKAPSKEGAPSKENAPAACANCPAAGAGGAPCAEANAAASKESAPPAKAG